MTTKSISLEIQGFDSPSFSVTGFAKRRVTGLTYLGLGAMITSGWMLRGREWIDAEAGIGYWLGIIGGSLMIALLLYPLRKRFRILRWMGSTRFWFRTHMSFGLIGPTLILFHSNFQLGSINGQVALYCMLAVALSGVVGRHIYAKIHNGLYGTKASFGELKSKLIKSQEHQHREQAFLPNLTKRLEVIDSEILTPPPGVLPAIGRALVWSLKARWVRWSLRQVIRDEIATLAKRSKSYRAHGDALFRAADRYTAQHLRYVRRIAQFDGYERMFSLWHVFHLPLFFMMVLSAIFHVLAVHMY